VNLIIRKTLSSGEGSRLLSPAFFPHQIVIIAGITCSAIAPYIHRSAANAIAGAVGAAHWKRNRRNRRRQVRERVETSPVGAASSIVPPPCTSECMWGRYPVRPCCPNSIELPSMRSVRSTPSQRLGYPTPPHNRCEPGEALRPLVPRPRCISDPSRVSSSSTHPEFTHVRQFIRCAAV
jgi:hypothetical protein